MPSGLPARVALVCTLLVGVTIARAERRPVAVIDLADNPKTIELATGLNPVLQQHPELRPIADPLIVPELIGEFRDDETRSILEAKGSKVGAEQQLARFDLRVAEELATNGLAYLDNVTPTTRADGTVALGLYAQLAFLRGLALLGNPQRTTDAREAFAIAHRLDPAFVPDPARYPPDVIRAFESATKAWTGKGKLAVGGSGQVWIDGTAIGAAPTEVEVAAGPHVVWLTGVHRETSARRVMVIANGRVVAAIADRPADARLKVRRARAQLRNAPDPAARAAAMKQLAELVGVRDAVLLTAANNKVVVQTWNAGTRDQAPGFSALRELKNEKPLDLLTPLAPPRTPPEDVDPPPETGGKKKIVVERRWYERRPVQAGIIVGVLAIAISSYYLYSSLSDDTVTWDPNTQVEMSSLGVRF